MSLRSRLAKMEKDRGAAGACHECSFQPGPERRIEFIEIRQHGMGEPVGFSCGGRPYDPAADPRPRCGTCGRPVGILTLVAVYDREGWAELLARPRPRPEGQFA